MKTALVEVAQNPDDLRGVFSKPKRIALFCTTLTVAVSGAEVCRACSEEDGPGHTLLGQHEVENKRVQPPLWTPAPVKHSSCVICLFKNPAGCLFPCYSLPPYSTKCEPHKLKNVVSLTQFIFSESRVVPGTK